MGIAVFAGLMGMAAYINDSICEITWLIMKKIELENSRSQEESKETTTNDEP